MRVSYAMPVGEAGTLSWMGDSDHAGFILYDREGTGAWQAVAEVSVWEGVLVVKLGPLGSLSREVLRVPVPSPIANA